MRHLLTQRRIRFIGLAIAAISLGFVGWSMYSSGLLASDAWRQPDVLMGILISGTVFALSLCLVFAAWYLVVMSVSQTHISWLEGFCIYSISQIYKYIPSNVVHHIGRYYMLRQRGVEHGAAAWGFLAETALILLASVIVAALFGASLVQGIWADIDGHGRLVFVVAAGALAIVGGVAAFFLRHLPAVQSFLNPFLRAQVLHAGLGALLLHIGARVIAGLALWALAFPVLGTGQLSIGNAIAVWATAWTLGYVTPGATAGLGVREAILIAALVVLNIPIAEATLLAVAFRLATTFGDIVFAAAGWLLQRIAGVPEASSQGSEF